jgi:hypothetical protein
MLEKTGATSDGSANQHGRLVVLELVDRGVDQSGNAVCVGPFVDDLTSLVIAHIDFPGSPATRVLAQVVLDHHEVERLEQGLIDLGGPLISRDAGRLLGRWGARSGRRASPRGAMPPVARRQMRPDWQSRPPTANFLPIGDETPIY